MTRVDAGVTTAGNEARAPMADTDTTGTVECEVQAGASDAEGCGMDAGNDVEVFERAAALELGAHCMVTDGRLGTMGGSETAMTADLGVGDDRSTNARAATARAHDTTGDAAAESLDDTPAALTPAGGVTKKRRAKRSRTGQNAGKCLRRAESLPAGRSGAPGPPPPDGGDGDNLV